MDRLVLALAFCAATSTTAGANADPPNEPRTETIDDTRIEGPFPTADAYCAFRDRQYSGDDTAAARGCQSETVENMPKPSAGQAIRAIRFVRFDSSVHLVVLTRTGWFGRSIGDATNDTVVIGNVRLVDIARSKDNEIVFEVSTSHDPCGCDDTYHDATATYACTVDDGALLCTSGIATNETMHLADIWSWSSTLSLHRDGNQLRVTRKILDSDRMSRAALRRLTKPIRITLHR